MNSANPAARLLGDRTHLANPNDVTSPSHDPTRPDRQRPLGGLRFAILAGMLCWGSLGSEPARADGLLRVDVDGAPAGYASTVVRFRERGGGEAYDLSQTETAVVDICFVCSTLGGNFYLREFIGGGQYRLSSGTLTEETHDDDDTPPYDNRNLISVRNDSTFTDFTKSNNVELDDEQYVVALRYQERAKYTVGYEFDQGPETNRQGSPSPWKAVGTVIHETAPTFSGPGYKYTCVGYTGTGTFDRGFVRLCSLSEALRAGTGTNNSITWKYELQADVELRSMKIDPGLVAAGETVTATIVVRNNGPDNRARDVVVTTTKVANATFGASSGCVGASVSGNRHRCPLADTDLAVGEERSFTLEIVTPSEDGFMNVTTEVSSHSAVESNLNNDERIVFTTVDGLQPSLAVVSPRAASRFGTVGDFIDLRGTASDDSGVAEVCWDDQCRSIKATGVAGAPAVDWFFRRLPIDPEATSTIDLVARDGAGLTTDLRVTVDRRGADEIIESLSFDGAPVDLGSGALLANPVAVTIDPALDVDLVQLLLNGERVASASGASLSATIDVASLPSAELADARHHLEVAVRLVGGRVVRDPRRIPIGIDGADPAVEDEALWVAYPAVATLGSGDFRGLSTDGRWAVVASPLRTALLTSEDVVAGTLRHVRQEVASATSSLRHFDGTRWISLGPEDLADPGGLLCDSTPGQPCLVLTAVAVEGGTLWIGTDQGLIRATNTVPPTVEAVFDAETAAGPAGHWITDLHVTAGGDLWVAHRGSRWHLLQPHASKRFWEHAGGVSRLRGSTWTRYRAQHAEDGSTDDGGTWQTVAGLRPTRVTTTGDGAVWVASEAGLSIFQDGTWRHESSATTKLPFDEVDALAVADVTVLVDPPPPSPGAADPPPFAQDQVWAWVGGRQGAAFLRLVPPAADDGTPRPGTPATTGSWAHFTRDSAPLTSDTVRDVALYGPSDRPPLAWFATDDGVFSFDPVGLTWLRHEEAGDGVAGSLATIGTSAIAAAVRLDAGDTGRVARVDLSLGVVLRSPVDGARAATGSDGLADVVLAWDPVAEASSYELFLDGESIGRTTTTSRVVHLPPGEVRWSVRALFDDDRRALARALPRRLIVLDGSGPIEFLTLEAPTVRHVVADDTGAIVQASSFKPLPAGELFPDLTAEVTGAMTSVGSTGAIEVHPVPIGQTTGAGDWRVDATSEAGGLVLGDRSSGRISLYEATLAAVLDVATVPDVLDVAGLDGGRFATLAGSGSVQLFERQSPLAGVESIGAIDLGPSLGATAIVGLSGGFAVLTPSEVRVYDRDTVEGYRLGARLALPDGLGTATDLAVDETGRLFVLFDGSTHVVVFGHDLAIRGTDAPAVTSPSWRQVVVDGQPSALASFSTKEGRPPIPDRDYEPPADPPPDAGAHQGTAGPLTVYTDGGPIAGATWAVGSGSHRIEYFLRATGPLSFDGVRLTGGGELFLDFDGATYPRFDHLFAAGELRVAGPGWTLDIGTGEVSGVVDLALPRLGTVQVDRLQVLGLGTLAGQTSRSGIRLGGAFTHGPSGFDSRFDSLFLGDFGGRFHATFGESGLDGLQAPFNSGRLTFTSEAEGSGVPLVLDVEGGLDLSSADPPTLAFALATSNICPGAPAAFDCDELFEVTLQDLELSEHSVRFDSAVGRVLDAFTLEIFGGELLAGGDDGFGLGTGVDGTGLKVTIPFADPLTFPGFFLGSSGLRFDGTVPVSIGRFGMTMTGLELVFGGDAVEGSFSLGELDFRYETGGDREFLLHMRDLEVPFTSFSRPPTDFPTAEQVIVRLREACDDARFDDCGCNPCADDVATCQSRDTNNDGKVTTYDRKEFFKIELCDASGFRFTDTEIAIPAFDLIVPNPRARPENPDDDTLGFTFGGARLTPDFIELTDPQPVTLFGAEVDFDLTRLGKDGFFTEKAEITVAGKSSGGDAGDDPKLRLTLRDFELGIAPDDDPPIRLGLSGGGFQRYGFGFDVAKSDLTAAICGDAMHRYTERDPIFDIGVFGVPVIGEVGGTVLIDDGGGSGFLDILCLEPPRQVKLGPLEISDLNFGDVPEPLPDWALDGRGQLKWADPAFFGGRIRFGKLPEIGAFAVLDDGTLDLLRAEVDFPAPGRHLFKGVFLQGLRAQYQISRSEFLGGATFSAGPKVTIPILLDDPVFLAYLDAEVVISGMGYLKANAGLRMLRAEGLFDGFPVAGAELILGKVYLNDVYKGTGVYFDGFVRLFYGVLRVDLTAWLYFDSSRFGGDLSGTVGLPEELPIIGGLTFAKASASMRGSYSPVSLAFFGEVSVNLLFDDVSVSWRIDDNGFAIKDRGHTRSSSRGFHRGYHDDTGLSVLTDFELLDARDVSIGGLTKDSRTLEFTVDRDVPGAIVRVDFSHLEGDADLYLEFPDGRLFTPDNTRALFPPDPDAPTPVAGDLPIGYRKQVFAGAEADPGDPDAQPPVLPRPARPALKEAAFVFAGPLALQRIDLRDPAGERTGETLDQLQATPVPQGTYRVTIVTDGMQDAGDALVEFLLDDNPPRLEDATVGPERDGVFTVDWQVRDDDGDDVRVGVHLATDRQMPTDGFGVGAADGYLAAGGSGGGSLTVDLCASAISDRNITAVLHLFLSLDDGRESPRFVYLDSFMPCPAADAPPPVEHVVAVAGEQAAEVYWEPLMWDAPDGVELTSYAVSAFETGGEGTASMLPVSLDVPLAGRSSREIPSGWVINEIHAEVDGRIGDANGDASVDAGDRFVELVNDSGDDQDLAGWSLRSGASAFAFPAGTIVPDQCAVVVFAGGAPTGTFGSAAVVVAGGLDLTPSDSVALIDTSGSVVTTATAGSAAEAQSRTRVPDILGPLWVDHATAPGTGGRIYSPGQRLDGSSFVGCGGRGQAILDRLTAGRTYRITVTPMARKAVEVTCFEGQEVPVGDICHPDAFPPPPTLRPGCVDDPTVPGNECLIAAPPSYGEPFEVVEEIAGKPSAPVEVTIPGGAVNSWPRIVSEPRTTTIEIGTGNVWTYLLQAVDADGDGLVLTVESGDTTIGAPELPAGSLEITPAPGTPNVDGAWTLTFTPGDDPQRIDRYPLRLRVADGQVETVTVPVVDQVLGTVDLVEQTVAAEAIQDFVLEVAHFDQAPVEASFLSRAPRSAIVGRAYVYDADVSASPESLVPRFFLRRGPAGMTVDPATGLVVWTPPIDGAGTSHLVVLEVYDPTPGCQSCTLDVEAFELQVVAADVPPEADQPLLVVSPTLMLAASEGATLAVELRNLGPPGTDMVWQAELVDDPGDMLSFEAGGDVASGRGDAILQVVAARNPTNQPRTAKLRLTATNPAGDPPVEGAPAVVTFNQSADTRPPTVVDVATRASRSEVLLSPCGTARAVDQLVVSFSETLSSGDGLAGDAASPSSYRLLATGPDLDLQTTRCAVVGDDDERIALDAVTYDAATRTVILDPAGGLLDDGLYRLLVCDTVEDLVGNRLADQDFQLSFRVDRHNLFDNAHFDRCVDPALDSWLVVETPPNSVSRCVDDADAAAPSGSACVLGAAPGASVLGQCQPVDADETYTLSARLSFTPLADTVAFYTQGCEFFTGPDCTGQVVGTTSSSVLADAPTDGWPVVESVIEPPATTASTLCRFSIEPLGAASTEFDLYLDQLFLGRVDGRSIFADGFESGRLDRWVTPVP